jgi:hypothetical protein
MNSCWASEEGLQQHMDPRKLVVNILRRRNQNVNPNRQISVHSPSKTLPAGWTSIMIGVCQEHQQRVTRKIPIRIAEEKKNIEAKAWLTYGSGQPHDSDESQNYGMGLDR